ncbi:hypothetical protein FFWV33_13315 [Flavobacterium faecale]|uniref:Uncharacterized protein n=2 Tax=Flavobacterium faecale TaxID=1355330 RepID=A0A2S1LF71_9FLAO|nr:hypothetical protein FFWV33_13315 [Flavobacterium faecale]
MLWNYLKELVVKRKVKASLNTEKSTTDNSTIKTVGLLIDENYFSEKQQLIEGVIANGIAKENIKVVVFKNKAQKLISENVVFCSPKNLSWQGGINNEAVKAFIATDFDLLINYYDIEKAMLLVITQQSKARFKVGFSSVDRKLNDLTITSDAENYQVFIHELFRYLKILNKI